MLPIIVMLGIFLFVLGVGYLIISRIPALLHTPLMSATNALSSITLLGALILLSGELTADLQVLIALACVMAAFNCLGGFVLTDRMFKMFKKKE
jgi:NAD(P) transhydrogenase subunit alpha